MGYQSQLRPHGFSDTTQLVTGARVALVVRELESEGKR